MGRDVMGAGSLVALPDHAVTPRLHWQQSPALPWLWLPSDAQLAAPRCRSSQVQLVTLLMCNFDEMGMSVMGILRPGW